MGSGADSSAQTNSVLLSGSLTAEFAVEQYRAGKSCRKYSMHLPVCWSCHMAETFRRKHPERIVEREEEPLRVKLYHSELR